MGANPVRDWLPMDRLLIPSTSSLPRKQCSMGYNLLSPIHRVTMHIVHSPVHRCSTSAEDQELHRRSTPRRSCSTQSLRYAAEMSPRAPFTRENYQLVDPSRSSAVFSDVCLNGCRRTLIYLSTMLVCLRGYCTNFERYTCPSFQCLCASHSRTIIGSICG